MHASDSLVDEEKYKTKSSGWKIAAISSTVSFGGEYFESGGSSGTHSFLEDFFQ